MSRSCWARDCHSPAARYCSRLRRRWQAVVLQVRHRPNHPSLIQLRSIQRRNSCQPQRRFWTVRRRQSPPCRIAYNMMSPTLQRFVCLLHQIFTFILLIRLHLCSRHKTMRRLSNLPQRRHRAPIPRSLPFTDHRMHRLPRPVAAPQLHSPHTTPTQALQLRQQPPAAQRQRRPQMP